MLNSSILEAFNDLHGFLQLLFILLASFLIYAKRRELENLCQRKIFSLYFDILEHCSMIASLKPLKILAPPIALVRTDAVKKFDQFEDNMLINNLKDFESEILALSEIRHRNIMQMYGYCSHPKHSFLVFGLIEMESLRMVLTVNEETKELDWKKKLNFVKGLINVFNNVLLDLDYEAHISYFGTNRILKPDSSNWTSLVGTYWCIAPKLDYIMKVDKKCGVYSFGVLTIEVFMRRRPDNLLSYLSSLASTSTSAFICDKSMSFTTSKPIYLNDQQSSIPFTVEPFLDHEIWGTIWCYNLGHISSLCFIGILFDWFLKYWVLIA
ncbi:hypothetical protein CXB51_025289 [Gossypium anomalum]|uniref:non-specific serine/threonine protein kinase n=1 Tax=Gossypium anomalum TaxID=47600 RepID=A0A8J5YGM4_9ROSI|nr:hypothetical protein CXB51_025289 [Gossypium anomalum]